MQEQVVGTGASRPFPDAERVVVQADGAELTLVVLAVTHVDGDDFALVMPEQAGDPCWWVFGYETDGDGKAVLSAIEDDERYDEVLHIFDDLVSDDEDAEA